MNTADLISAYLNNEMSPERERQFLLSVAASDQLRLALKSHVMLDRIVLRQAQELQVPLDVRSTILGEATISLGQAGESVRQGGRTGSQEGRAARGGLPSGVTAAVMAVALFAGGYLTRLGGEQILPAVPSAHSLARLPLATTITSAFMSVSLGEPAYGVAPLPGGDYSSGKPDVTQRNQTEPLRRVRVIRANPEGTASVPSSTELSKNLPRNDMASDPLDPTSDRKTMRRVPEPTSPAESTAVNSGHRPAMRSASADTRINGSDAQTDHENP